MTTMELIQELRDWAEVGGAGSLYGVLNAAADRLEAMDERIAIMDESYSGIETHLASVRAVNIILGIVCGVMALAITLLALRG